MYQLSCYGYENKSSFINDLFIPPFWGCIVDFVVISMLLPLLPSTPVAGRVEDGRAGRVEEGSAGRVEEGLAGRVEEGSAGRVEEGSAGRVLLIHCLHSAFPNSDDMEQPSHLYLSLGSSAILADKMQTSHTYGVFLHSNHHCCA